MIMRRGHFVGRAVFLTRTAQSLRQRCDQMLPCSSVDKALACHSQITAFGPILVETIDRCQSTESIGPGRDRPQLIAIEAVAVFGRQFIEQISDKLVIGNCSRDR